jgi:hypothetical protein
MRGVGVIRGPSRLKPRRLCRLLHAKIPC